MEGGSNERRREEGKEGGKNGGGMDRQRKVECQCQLHPDIINIYHMNLSKLSNGMNVIFITLNYGLYLQP